ncbi:MAG: hypothetical protein K2X03_28610 [Bryobacteraceae bacterium]|nr:hypothetical protein [Bryobacteraceae bacterium]
MPKVNVRPREQASAGEQVVMPVEAAPARRKLGTAQADFRVPDDFDASLPEEVLRGFER